MGVVTEGIIAMPYELAMADELTRMQFYQTVTSEIATLRARLETVEAETIERAVKRIKADKDIQGLVKARLFIALRNLEPRHD